MILLVDSNYLCYRMKHGMKKLELSFELMKTEIIFGFVKQIKKLAKEYKTNKFVFAWDSKKNYRKKIASEYKANRRRDLSPEDRMLSDISFQQFSELRRAVLPTLGFRNNFIQTGMEADDIIASVSKKYWEEEIMIVSNDSDMYQLLTDTHSMITMTKSEFMKKHKILPLQWAEVKALMGDSSDNIEGIKGVGPVTACEHLRGEIDKTSGRYKDIMLSGSQDLFERNLKLIKLPFEGTNDFELNWNEKLSIMGFIHVCSKYGFESLTYQDELKSWQNILGLK